MPVDNRVVDLKYLLSQGAIRPVVLGALRAARQAWYEGNGDHTATEGPGYLLETGDPFGSVHSINVMIQNNGLLGGTSFDYHQDGHALDQPNPECLGYTHIAALYVDSRVCCS
jgi:hypothetical protein